VPEPYVPPAESTRNRLAELLDEDELAGSEGGGGGGGTMNGGEHTSTSVVEAEVYVDHDDADLPPPPDYDPAVDLVSPMARTQSRAGFKGSPGPKSLTNRGPPTKPFIFYFSLTIDAYETTT